MDDNDFIRSLLTPSEEEEIQKEMRQDKMRSFIIMVTNTPVSLAEFATFAQDYNVGWRWSKEEGMELFPLINSYAIKGDPYFIEKKKRYSPPPHDEVLTLPATLVNTRIRRVSYDAPSKTNTSSDKIMIKFRM